jgi:hypothetical protein
MSARKTPGCPAAPLPAVLAGGDFLLPGVSNAKGVHGFTLLRTKALSSR